MTTTDAKNHARIDRGLLERGDREERLPQWAQQLLSRLRTTVVRLEQERDTARFATNPDESDTLIDFYEDPPIGLGKGRAVRFRTSESRFDYIDVETTRDGAVQVSGSSSLVIRLRHSNVLRVSVDR